MSFVKRRLKVCNVNGLVIRIKKQTQPPAGDTHYVAVSMAAQWYSLLAVLYFSVGHKCRSLSAWSREGSSELRNGE